MQSHSHRVQNEGIRKVLLLAQKMFALGYGASWRPLQSHHQHTEGSSESLTFQKSSWYGDDLCPAAWDYVFSLDLLCAQLGWIWTVFHVIRKSVWLILNTWLKQTQTEETKFRNVSVAAIFRLLGRLGQQGLRENVVASVEDLTKSVAEFGRQKDLPWVVQLAVVYATHDLAPSNPKVALNALETWKKDLTEPVPPAVTKCLKQISFLCLHIKTKNCITINN
ncbi:little elongation complex subunit 1-like [Silurus meridionalis]|uniref:little elongation complex subunit 1-like n=1 Tax=Silurus meridionalis TaxID=175797 RepID=UPI001EEADF1E|nr:little elongation complex subunit 1-like [Silurus meridionalis]